MTAIANAFIKNDKVLFVLINRKLHYKFLDRYFGTITHLGSTPFIVILTCIFLYALPATGEVLAINLFISQLIIHAFKRVINRTRPYESMVCNLISSPPQCVYSFPSGHLGASLSAALVLSASFPDLSLLFFILAYSISFSRIYLGFHFVSDVVVGLLIAYLTFQFLPISFFFSNF